MDGEALTTSTAWVWLLLAALPLVLTLATSFTKVSVVLGALRVGLGAQALLPLPVLLALSLVVTALVMAPVALAVGAGVEAAGGLQAVVQGGWDAWVAALAPLEAFVVEHGAVDERRFVAELRGLPLDHPIVSVAAFLITELREALAMAVLIIVPFVLVDLLVAQVLALMGLVNQPTAIVTVPLKLLLFLAVGGWDAVVGGLVEGYA